MTEWKRTATIRDSLLRRAVIVIHKMAMADSLNSEAIELVKDINKELG